MGVRDDRIGTSRRSVLLLLPFAAVAHAIVIREDVPDARYRVPTSEFPALVDLPQEGHGTLIADQWVVTAAHAVHGRTPERVMIRGTWRPVSQTILYPGFQMPYVEMTGDASHLVATLKQMHDIALLRLASPVEDVKPVPLYRGGDEQGKVIVLYGKGATGNGQTGERPDSPHRGQLRRAYNRVASAENQWLCYDFDCGPNALLLEGVMGSGDSGGPVLINTDRRAVRLAGLNSWKSWRGDLKNFRAGVCGQAFYCSRISYYLDWIDGVTHPSHRRSPS